MIIYNYHTQQYINFSLRTTVNTHYQGLNLLCAYNAYIISYYKVKNHLFFVNFD